MLFLIFDLTISVQSQVALADYTIYYEHTYITDTVNMFYLTENYILYRIENESYFLNQNGYFNDSIGADFVSKMGDGFYNDPKKLAIYDKEIGPLIRRYKTRHRLLKNWDQKLIKIILPKAGRYKYMQAPLNLFWTISPETDTLLGLKCRKASTEYGGREYTAWFTSEIPISDGPYTFQGLPGLILKVADKDLWYEFKVSDMVLKPCYRLKNATFMNIHFQTKLSREEYVQESMKMKDNPQFPPGMMNVTPEMKLNLKEQYKKRFDLLLEQNEKRSN